MSDLQPFLPTRKRPMKLNTLVTLMVCAIIGSVLLVVFALTYWPMMGYMTLPAAG